MPDSPLAHAHRLLTEAVAALAVAAGPVAGDDELVSVLTLGEGTVRRLDQVTVAALGDLLGWERFDARRRLVAADHIRPRIGLGGGAGPPWLPATAAVFDAAAASLRHVEVIARVLGSPAATRLTVMWAGAETQLAVWIPDCTPNELQAGGTQLVDTLDMDGPEPDDRPAPQLGRPPRRGPARVLPATVDRPTTPPPPPTTTHDPGRSLNTTVDSLTEAARDL